jgi:hypothetical protein
MPLFAEDLSLGVMHAFLRRMLDGVARTHLAFITPRNQVCLNDIENRLILTGKNMNFFYEMLNSPWSQWRLEQRIVAVLIVSLVVGLVVYALIYLLHIAERRRESRDALANPIDIFWQDLDGLAQHSQGRCLDVSAGGLRVELSDPLPVPARIKFRVSGTGVEGTALVRHCQPKGAKYVVGAQFTSLSQGHSTQTS